MDDTRSSAAEMVSIASRYSYPRAENDTLAPVRDQGAFTSKDYNRTNYVIRWKSGEKVDHRLLTVLEIFFHEIFVKRREIFKKIFPELQDQFTEVFKKIGNVVSKNKNHSWKYQTMQRSLSLGSPRTSKQSQDQGLSELRGKRFKVRTVVHDHQGPSRTAGDNEGRRASEPRPERLIARHQTAGFEEERLEPKPKRFKVKTPKVIIAEPESQGGQSGTRGTSSSTSSAATNSN